MAGAAFVTFAAVVSLSHGNRHPLIVLAVVHLVVIWSAVAALSIWARKSERPMREKLVYRMLVILTMIDAALTVGLSESTVCGNRRPWDVVAAKHVESLDLIDRGLDRQLSTDVPRFPLNSNLLSKTPVLTGYCGMVNGFHAQYAKTPVLSRDAIGPERIWFSPTAVEVPLADDCFQEFRAAADRTGRQCLVISDRKERSRSAVSPTPSKQLAEAAKNIAAAPPVAPIPTKLIEYTPNRLVLDVAASRDGWLLVTDRWAVGWRATVNGENANVAIGNFIFRAVRVHQGNNRVAFRYSPAGHPWLLIASWATLASLLAATAIRRKNQGGMSHACVGM
jgi:hypothetical protein